MGRNRNIFKFCTCDKYSLLQDFCIFVWQYTVNTANNSNNSNNAQTAVANNDNNNEDANATTVVSKSVKKRKRGYKANISVAKRRKYNK